MTLIVDPSVPDSGFPGAALAALGSVCPCKGLKLEGASGKVVVDPSPPWCRCSERHPAGGNLVMDLAAAAASILIVKTNGDNGYLPGEIDWSESNLDGGIDVDGSTQRPPFIGLAHELVHAWAEFDGDTTTAMDDEKRAVCGENQVRAEAGVPLRRGYDSVMPDIPPEYCRQNGLLIDVTPKESCLPQPSFEKGSSFRDWLAKVVLAVLRLLQRQPKRGGPPLTTIEFGTGGQSFDDLLTGPPPPPAVLNSRVRVARRTRDTAPARVALAQLAPAFDAARHAILVEAAAVAGSYRVLMVLEEQTSVRLVTNLRLANDPTYWIEGPGDLVEYRYGASVVDDVASRLARSAFQPLVAGNVRAVDGTVRFVTLKRGPDMRRTALYYYRFRGVDHRGFPAQSDSGFDGWETVSTAHEIWRDLLQRTPDSISVLARRRFP
ncbi:MAG: hypothetical protein JNJ80_14765 [Gemmatimonadetes bacterium]|nr:hypothetical protein [Gemmatimonadota bacterium]MCC7131695.1 hypothetical protein [Gemmatimonadales bacterium]